MTAYDKQVLLEYLNPHQPFIFQDSARFSTLIAGLRDCRLYSGRELTSGKFRSNVLNGEEGNWLSAIGYFTILDQIGSCYRPIGTPEPQSNSNKIKLAIENFAYELIDSSERQLNALIALRNAFTHDFNLLNIPDNTKKIDLQQHKFTVVADKNNWVVDLPQHIWNGDIAGKDFYDTSDSTFVNLIGFGNLVEEIYQRIYNLVREDRIHLNLPIEILINKYTFVTSNHPMK